MNGMRGDFIGFSYNDVHSSDLGIIRVSNGSRFDENLLPTGSDNTDQILGGDGTLYFGSRFTQRQIPLSFAFDELTENQLAFMQQLFGDKKVHPLVFDEKPYKTYYAKVTGSTMIKYIPFTEKGKRVYKGEGTLTFTCYQPYAICSKKFLDEYENLENNEWVEASGLLAEQEIGLDVFNNGQARLYNPGVKPSDLHITMHYTTSSTNGNSSPRFAQVSFIMGDKELHFEGADAKGASTQTLDDTIVFNSKNHLIEGYCEGKKSGNIYNEYISAGDFFEVPITIKKGLLGNVREEVVLTAVTKEVALPVMEIEYNYYYY